MSDLKTQEKLTEGRGWKKVIVDRLKEDVEQVKTKAQNIWGGVKVVAKKLKGKE
jgi:hypothetical protein